MAQGMDEPEIRRQADRFRDFWVAKAGKDAAKMNWEATWRNWIRRALDDRPPAAKGASNVHSFKPKDAGLSPAEKRQCETIARFRQEMEMDGGLSVLKMIERIEEEKQEGEACTSADFET
jgi:hypothetical protein